MLYLIKDDLKETIGQIQSYLPGYLREYGVKEVKYRRRGRFERFLIRIFSQMLSAFVVGDSNRKVFTIITWSNHDHVRLESLRSNIVPWFYDMWDIQKAASCILAMKSRTVLVSSTDAKSKLSAKLPKVKFHVLYEAIEPRRYDVNKPKYLKKKIDLLIYGRNLVDQKKLKGLLADDRLNNLHLTKTNNFHTSESQFISYLWESKFSVSYPKTHTDPVASGGIDAITQRYLEQMYCGVITVGVAPKDLVEVLGYDPVISMDLFVFCYENNMLEDPFFDVIRALNRESVERSFLVSDMPKKIISCVESS